MSIKICSDNPSSTLRVLEHATVFSCKAACLSCDPTDLDSAPTAATFPVNSNININLGAAHGYRKRCYLQGQESIIRCGRG